MATKGPKKISVLPVANTIANSDLFIVVSNTTGTAISSRVNTAIIISTVNNHLNITEIDGGGAD